MIGVCVAAVGYANPIVLILKEKKTMHFKSQALLPVNQRSMQFGVQTDLLLDKEMQIYRKVEGAKYDTPRLV